MERIVKKEIFNFFIYFRTELSNNHLSKDFIEFFNSYFKKENFPDLNLRFYVSILQSYMQYAKIQNKELIKEWDNNIKPFLLKRYPFEQNGIFNINADIKYLIKEIDNIIKDSNINKSNNILYIKKIADNKNKKIGMEKGFKNDKLKDKEEDLSPLKINNLNIEKEQEKYENNLNIIKIEDYEEKNNNKRKYNVNNKFFYSTTIASKSTSVSSIYDELNKRDSIKSDYMTESTIKPKSLVINQEVNPNFFEEFETEKVTIIHKRFDKINISKMTFNLFLKKIVTTDFYTEYILYATNFAEQCFYFIKKDIIFNKCINCYNYYSQLKVPFNQRKNLVYLVNLLVIKMYDYNIKINIKDEIIEIIKKFYNNIIAEIKQIINKSTKTTEKIQNFIVSGINAIKQSVNNFNKNIKNNNNNLKSKDNLKINSEKVDSKIINHINEKEINSKNENNNINNKEKFRNLEALLKECEKIITLLKIEKPNHEFLSKIEKSLHIYSLKVIYKINLYKNKNNENLKLSKCQSQKFLTTYSFTEKNIKKSKKKNYFYCLDWDTREIGEELIYVTQTALSKIKRKELYNGAFTKKSKKINCPGIMENIDKFNKLTFFVIEDILSYDLPESRAKVMEKWANVADYCRRRKDYNDIFSINSAFKNFIISNLSLTWKSLGSKALKLIREIDTFCSFEGNYKNVRDDMKLLTRNDFYTPYLGLLLKDLNFFEEKFKYFENGNLINFDKINGVQRVIDEFFHFQKTVDKVVTVLPEKLNFFENLEVLKESYLEKLAQKLEPKFTLYLSPKNEKRLTNIDRKYFIHQMYKSKSNHFEANNNI